MKPSSPSARDIATPSSESLPRFLLAGPLPPPEYGQSLEFEMLCSALRKSGHNCLVVNIQGKTPSALGRVTIKRSIETLYPLSRFIGGLIARRPSVYITISRSRAGFIRDMLMIWIAWLRGCHAAVHVKGGDYDDFYHVQPGYWRLLIRHTLRRTRCIIILSERLRGMFAFDPTLGERIAVVPNGLPFSLNAPARGRRLCQDRPIHLLFLSNLIQSKGYLDVLEAVTILRKTTAIRLKAVFAGRFLSSSDDPLQMSPEKAEVRFHEYVAAHGLKDIVRYVGPVVGETKRRLYETSDFFLLPTKYFTEGQPVSIIEAMAHGCVVISTDYRAIPDLVVDGVTGVLIEPSRSSQIAEAVQRILSQPDQYEAMSQAAVDRYEKFYTMQRHFEVIVSLLKETKRRDWKTNS